MEIKYGILLLLIVVVLLLHNAQYYDVNTLAITSDNSIVVGAGPYILKYNINGDKVWDFITP